MISTKAASQRTNKHDREKKVLLELVDFYIKTGKPVGSNTLRDLSFDDLSSATIRNYFSRLEEEGYLQQQHSSGGRLPTEKAYRLYVREHCDEPISLEFTDSLNPFDELRDSETKEISSFLQKATAQLASLTRTAVFLSTPKFEQDFIVGIKIMPIDSARCLCVLLTDFGEIITETLEIPHKLSIFSSKRIESYFNWRLTGHNKPTSMRAEEEGLAQSLYNELMLRYIVSHSQFETEDLYRTGFSSLLAYPEFHDSVVLANSLALFENTHGMRLLLKDCMKHNTHKIWIGDDLITYSPNEKLECSIMAIPYRVNNQPIGAIGVLGPIRLPYRSLHCLLYQFADSISQALTRNLYKFKISLRQSKASPYLRQQEWLLIGQTERLLIEDKRSKVSEVNPPSRRK